MIVSSCLCYLALFMILILIDTVISLHEDTSSLKDEASALESIRGNTLSVLSQLSNEGHESADPISLQTVRQALVADHGDPGIEGSSSLFYYLFDDWRAVYSIVGNFHYRLDELHNAMMITHIQKPSYPSIPMKQIIPRLHMLGRQFRQMDHLYTAYKNLITRITAQKPAPDQGRTTPRSFSGLSAHHRGVTLAPNAVTRFERLSDRIELLILSEIREFTAEKEALVATVSCHTLHSPPTFCRKILTKLVCSTSTLPLRKTRKPPRDSPVLRRSSLNSPSSSSPSPS